jgi:serine/threonine-protein kinase RsbT
MSRHHAEELVVAASELATNLVRHSVGGTIRCKHCRRDNRRGVEVEALDEGPGISDLDEALRDGFSTRGSLGGGLPSARSLVDDFHIESGPAGTRVNICKWLTPT